MLATRRRLLIVVLSAVLLLVTSLAVVSAQGGGDHIPDVAASGLGQVGDDADPDNGDGAKGPAWARAGFDCSSDPDDPDGRGGPPFICGKGGELLTGADAGKPMPPGQAKKLGLDAGASPGFPGKGKGPAWARTGFNCGDREDGGPSFICGGFTADSADGPKGPAWMR